MAEYREHDVKLGLSSKKDRGNRMELFARDTSSPWLTLCKIGLLTSCALILGCGHEPGSGRPRGGSAVTLTCDGVPIQYAVLSVDNVETGEAGGAMTNAEGVAEFDNVVRGSYRLKVTPPRRLPPSLTDDEKEAIKNLDWRGLIPGKFRKFSSSGLVLEIEKGVTEYQFDLKN